MHISTTRVPRVCTAVPEIVLRAAALLLLAAWLSPLAALAQPEDPYYQWVQDYLSDAFRIEADEATFVLGESSLSVLEGVNAYGQSSSEIVPVDESEPDFVGWQNYLRYERTTPADNQWGGGILYNNRTAWEEGDVGLALIFYRGDVTGGPAGIPIQYEIFEGDGVVWEAPLDGTINLTSDWQTLAIPFQVGQAVPTNHSQFAFWVGSQALTIEMPAPVLLNFGDRYTTEILQNLIDTGGQLGLTASFSASTRRGVPPFDVTFNASNSAPAEQITSYEWDFGDGSTGTGVSPTHTYTEEGRFTVTLTVRDGNGQSDVSASEIVGFDGIGLPDAPLEIPYTASPPTIDGTVDEVWSGAAVVAVDYLVSGAEQYNGLDDASATVHALWDADNLYLLYDVRDDALFNDSPESYQDDSVDLYLDGGNEKSTTYGDNDAQYEFSWYSPDSLGHERVTGNAVENGRAEGVDYTSVRTAQGYAIEVVVPWSNVDARAVPGGRIGIEFMLNDSDLSGPTQSSKLSWFALQDNAWQRTDVFATAVLTGGEDAVTAAQFHYATPTGRYLMDVPVQFDGSASYAPGGVTSYEWDFGDGTFADGAIVSHTFGEVGTYDVSLTVTGNAGVTDTYVRQITIADGTGLPEKPLLVPRATTAIALDGEMESAWETAQQVTLGTRANGDPPVNAADLSAEARLLWDAEYLYVFFTVADDTLYNNSESTWQDDAPEIYLDGNNEKTEGAYDANDAQIELGWVPEAMQDTMEVLPVTGCTSCLDGDPILAGVTYASRTTDHGYNIEARIAWSGLGVEPSEGHDFGLELMVNDDDLIQDGDLDSRESKLQWFGAEGEDDPWQWAHVFGNARLVNILPSGVDEVTTELPAAFAIEGVYPNPFNPSTTAILQVRQAGDYRVRIYNVLGQLVSRQSLNVQQPGRVELGLDFSRYASGMYLISVEHLATSTLATTRAILIK